MLDETIKDVSNQINGVEETKSISNVSPSIQISNSNTIEQENTKKSTQLMPTTPKPINKQIETRTLDGKRRITPMFIPANVET